ncbi:centrosomal and chromosomal factor [Toxorhynchites rutilus septentrionalis]|uniref:centrosomal and chromosomal factor n=1 Tax=Toxorhynchites rutilus septentrionalis TaxID=329112 RepID=UPI002478A1F3|nr:centrosomal and chromosomal factor [Toxorhynchites rutilus septentrionalis]
MAMAACYPNYDLSSSSGMSQHQQQAQLHHMPVSSRLSSATPMAQKDYSIPLHVDCSVEYELPNQAKPPVGARVEPLLMIHPCYFRKMESQRRSPFVNNMPNSSRSSNSLVANVVDSSSLSRRSSKSSSQQAQQQQQQQQHVVVSSHQNSSMHHHQNLQQQIDEYVQRQMAQRSQQAHYPVGTNSQQQQQQSQHVQSQHHRHHTHQPQPQQQQLHQQQQQSHLTSQQQTTNQYNLQSHQQQQQQQLANTSDWSRYMGPDGVVRSYGKVNLANQTAYSNSNSSSSKSKAIKRSNTGMPQMAHANAAGTGQQQQNLMPASCAAFNSGGSLEGGLPSAPRWDIEKTSMAAVPRDFQAGPESLPIKANASLLAGGNTSQTTGSNNNYQPSATMYRNPSVVGKRDAMLSGGCGVYSNSSNNNNNNNTTNNNSTELGLTASGLWDPAALLEKSPMAAIPRDYQAGPEHLACSKMGAAGSGMLTSGHSLMRTTAINNNHHSNSNNNSSSGGGGVYPSDKGLFVGKYRQHQRPSHRLHPYMMTSSMGGSFPPLMTPAFPQMQQVSCYNV